MWHGGYLLVFTERLSCYMCGSPRPVAVISPRGKLKQHFLARLGVVTEDGDWLILPYEINTNLTMIWI